MVDLTRPVRVVLADGAVLFEGLVESNLDVMAKTLAERGDPSGIFPAEVTVHVGR